MGNTILIAMGRNPTAVTALDKPLLSYGALLFDLDGVITPTADLHREAWRRMFSAFLEKQGARDYVEQDYFDYLDGRRRDEGVAALLESRGIHLDIGHPDDSADVDTIHGLGARKNEDFLKLVAEGVDAYPGSVQLLDAIRAKAEAGEQVPALAIVSSSKNARPVLDAAGLLDRFPVIVDGIVATERELPGKPAPDTYLYGAELSGAKPEDAVVIEDATSGVASGKAGGFGLVLGVDRGTGVEALKKAGADVVVSDLAELL
ncbi:putative glycosyl hydrolase [Corynebacterium urogenitale]|uniref:Putative glycosyl hydrolase n=2 Tax=Corynebacterium urogenitale TaxID=2487892 RepID=A0A5J6ZCP0_9CORY|nr:putative glycosyl hydrolase [Corynebacterium urogenitale]